MYERCLDWKHCANADQFPIPRTRIIFQLAAETLDTFVNYLSYRTLESHFIERTH